APGPLGPMDPCGSTPAHRLPSALVAGPGLLIVCGPYEGIDDRVRAGLAAREISIGDYVLSGGEIPAMVLIDAVARLVPSIVGDPDSLAHDSFTEIDRKSVV